MIYWIWLGEIPGIGPKLSRALLSYFKTPKNIYDAGENELIKVSGIGRGKVKKIVEHRSLDVAKRIWKVCQEKNIHIMTLYDEGYPREAKILDDMPVHLYYKGILKKDSLGAAVVGSRRCSQKGKNAAVEIATNFARKGIPVVSGMAKGIDSYAHTACLKADGYTVAVLANGLDICYPSEHKLLMQRIEERGLLLSEYPPGVRPQKSYFPRRNRIIAAWSKQVVMIDPGKRSGAWITKDFAKKYKRDVKIFTGGQSPVE